MMRRCAPPNQAMGGSNRGEDGTRYFDEESGGRSQATALVTTNPSAVDSWRDHFFGIRSWFFSVDVVLILHSVTTASLLRDVPLLHPLRALQAVGLTISILGAASASPRLHATIAPAALAVQSLGLGSLFFRLQGSG